MNDVTPWDASNLVATYIPYADLYLIGGPSGSGKTCLANLLAKLRGALILRLDNYFVNEDQARHSFSLRYGSAPQWDHPKSLDLQYAVKNITELLNKKRTRYPIYSFAENRRIGYRHAERMVRQTLIVEGIHALLLKRHLEAERYKVFSIFMDAAVEVRRERVRIRDARERHRTVSNFSRRFYFMRIAEQRWIAGQIREADLIVDSSNDDFEIVT